jgi:hypothetical protein
VGMLIAEPAQIPACVIHTPGSHLAYLTTKRSLGQGCDWAAWARSVL